MIEWFFDSLHLQCDGNYTNIKLVVVDFHAEIEGRQEYIKSRAHCPIIHTPPKPTPWQGKYRLTKDDYFAAANARNTALCYADDGYIVFVDDLSVLLPGWLQAVREAQVDGYIACGSYCKVLNLVVDKGVVTSYDAYRPGVDSRIEAVQGDAPVKCGGNWMFGCSVALPVEALLHVNGFDEDCDSMGSEDYITGLMLGKNGFEMRYCKRMRTLESEERHNQGKPMKRIIKPMKGFIDSSHAILQWVINGERMRAPNYANLRELRAHILAGGQFPTGVNPQHDYRDGQPLTEM